MPSRRKFIASSIAAAAVTLAGRAADAKPAATPGPTPSATPPTEPSSLARQLARALARDLPNAKLSDATVGKIAKDIEDGFAITKGFRKRRLANADEPDFAFLAAEGERP